MSGSRLKSIAIVCASTLVALGLAEVGLRATGVQFSDSFYELDFQTGWRLRAKAQGWQRSEGEAFIEINSQGMRDVERKVEKPAGVYRVALLGDSFTEAMQVGLEKTFGGLMEGRNCGSKGKLEALNFGVSGYGTAQNYIAYRERAAKFAPDVVALVFFAGNDFYNNVRLLNPSNADAAPYYRLEADGKLSAVAPFADGGKPGPASVWLREVYTGLHARLRLAQVVTEAYYKSGRGRTRAAEQARIVERYGKDYMEWLAYVAPRDEAMRESWMVTERLIRMMAEDVKGSGRRFVLVLADNAIQALPDAADRTRFESKYGLASIDYADLRLKEWAEKNGIEVVWLAEALRAVAVEKKEYLHGFGQAMGSGHWNVAGHRVVAERLMKAVCGD